MKDIIPVVILGLAVVGYFMRIEKQISEIKNDLAWIKEYIRSCQPR